MNSSTLRLLIVIMMINTCLGSFAQKFKNMATTPPMGWNSWNNFGCNVNEKIIRSTADAMVSSGMKDAGYRYIIIDDCWQVDRDSMGIIQADPVKFPSGIKALADYIHQKGLKFGIYTCAGRHTCKIRPGSRGYEFQDALTYARWGVDYLKEDWCDSDGQNAIESYTLMRDALYKAGRPVVFSICEWGYSSPWMWADTVGSLYRTSGDIQNNWTIPSAHEGHCWGGGMIVVLDMQEGLEKFAGPNHWNDPDMLEVGNSGFTQNESRAHFSLWCMLAAPLIAGNDLSSMNLVTKEILTNKDVIALDQDPLGKQGFKIQDYGEFELFYKPLQNGDAALCFFNRYDQPVTIEWNWENLSLLWWKDKQKMNLVATINRSDFKMSGSYDISDLWKKSNLGTTKQLLKAEIPGHDVLLLKLTKK